MRWFKSKKKPAAHPLAADLAEYGAVVELAPEYTLKEAKTLRVVVPVGVEHRLLDVRTVWHQGRGLKEGRSPAIFRETQTLLNLADGQWGRDGPERPQRMRTRDGLLVRWPCP